jgi:Carboxypeptidase regulatory-like domain
MRGFRRLALLAVMCSLIAPAIARAQNASIAGVVKDTSGAVLPGVTVEVSSPALIEKTRTAVTDGAGQYKIVSLLPGLYEVTFTLSGFATYKRDGIEVTGSQTIAVNGEMKVGTVAETITVTGETPIVDVQSASVQKVVTKEVVDAIPTGRLGINLAALQPGMILGATSGTGALSGNANLATAQDVGGTGGDTFTDLSIHGGKASEQRQTIAGLSAATVIRFGESLSSSPSFTAMQEMSVDSSGADASHSTGGVRINYVPRDGGNTFKGLMFVSYANNSMQGTNYTTIADDPVTSLQARGLTTQPGALKEVYDYNPGYGGPILKDKLWFFGSARWTGAINYVPQNYPNKNFIVGVTPSNLFNNTTMTYSPDLTQELLTAYSGGGGRFREQTLRLAWQVTPKNKIGAYYNNKWRRQRNAASLTAWESVNDTYFFPFSDQLVQWTNPLTNRLLLEAGIWHHQETWGSSISPFNLADPLAVGVTDTNPSPTITPGYSQLIQNYHGRVGAIYTPSHNPNTRTNFGATYVTGSHAFKTGVDFSWAERGFWNGSIVPYSYTVQTTQAGKVGIPVPTGLSLRSDGCNDPLPRMVNGQLTTPVTSYNSANNCPTFQTGKIDGEGGVFVQDKWTMNRVTLSLGARLDFWNSSIPGYHLDPSIITPNRNYDVPTFQTLRQKDFTPKMAASWDVFGDGKTALKANVAKYVLGQAITGSNPLINLSPFNVVLTANRSWNDNNGNFIPDCDLTNPAAQGPGTANPQVDTCGVPTGQGPLMYQNSPGAALAAGDDNARYGWNNRSYSWEFSLSAQRELTRGVSIYGGYFRRLFGNFFVTDDLSHTVNDFQQYSVTSSAIPPPGASAGGATLPADITTGQYYNQKLNTGGASNYVGLSKDLFPGSRVIDHWNGFDVSVNMRLPGGAIFQGGTSTGRQTYDNCDIVDPANAGKFGDRSPLVESLNVAITGAADPRGPIGTTIAYPLSSCHVQQVWQTQLKFLGSYTLPKIDVQLGASFQNIPGIELYATYQAPNSDLARPVDQGGLGRLPFGATSATAITNVTLIQPEREYYDRINQLDLRIGKILRYGRYRANISLDLYNLFNKSTITSASFFYSASQATNQWLLPATVISPRLLKVSTTFDF